MSARCATFAVHAACLRGVEAFGVTVEVSASGTIPSLTIVGMADAAVMEARSRIRCALRSSGFDVPRCALTVSLAPGDIRKTGSGLDLPIAVAIFSASRLRGMPFSFSISASASKNSVLLVFIFPDSPINI